MPRARKLADSPAGPMRSRPQQGAAHRCTCWIHFEAFHGGTVLWRFRPGDLNAGVLRAEVSRPNRSGVRYHRGELQGLFLWCKTPLICAGSMRPGLNIGATSYRSIQTGLAGSNCNGAYAGSKFGGIGLTQSLR
jgi:hypothetical protein